jgi:hypothetical protein
LGPIWRRMSAGKLPRRRFRTTLWIEGKIASRFEIEDDLTFVGGHGATVKRAEIVPALAEKASGAL